MIKSKQILGAFLVFITLVTFSFIVFNNGESQFKIKFYNTHTEYHVYENNSHYEKIINGTIEVEIINATPIYSTTTYWDEYNQTYVNFTEVRNYNYTYYNETINIYERKFIEDEGFVLAADEYIKIIDGTKIMRAKSREQLNWSDENYWYYQNIAYYKENITTYETFKFRIDESNIESTPLKRSFECHQCMNKFVQFEIRDILYEGETKKITSPFSFGHNMNIEWEENEDFSWAKVYQQKSSDKIIVKFKANEEFEQYNVRLYDPLWFNSSWSYYKEITNLTGNITYMYFNKSIHDNADFNDTRFVSCYNNSLVFNHTLEAKLGTYAQFRINNLGENCSLRYYGNSEATSTSNASDVYFNPTNTYYLDANANDFVGNNHGTVTGATLSSGYINGSYDFDGTDDYLDIPNAMTTSTVTTMSFWIKSDTDETGVTQYLLDDTDGTNRYYCYLQSVDDGFEIGANGVEIFHFDSTTASKVFSQSWVYLTIIYKSGASKFYIDGVQEGSTSTVSFTKTATDFRIASKFNNIEEFNGKLDEFMIYDKELNADQIYKLYTQTAPNVIEGNETKEITLTVTLIIPINNSKWNRNGLSFSYNSTDKENLTNTTMYIWHSNGTLFNTNFTILSGISNITNFDVEIPDGSYLWNAKTYTNTSNTFAVSNFSFEIDTINPNINVTFPTNGSIYDSLVNEINLTISDEHIDSCLYTFDDFITNHTFPCNETNLNITGNTTEGINYLFVFANDTFNNTNITGINFTIDLTNPIVNIIYPENIGYDFNITTLNYTLNETNPSTCWYSLDNGTTNSSKVTPGENFTGISSENGYNTWIVYCDDTAARIGFDSVTFIIQTINLTLDGLNQNIISELNTSINVTASLDIGNISVDINHPDYGINYINSILNTSFNFIIDYFRKNLFDNGLSYSFLDFNGTELKNISLAAHQYDELDSIELNMSGNATDIYFYSNNEVDEFYSGTLNGSNLQSTDFFNLADGRVKQVSLFYTLSASQLVYNLMDTFTNSMNISFTLIGEKYGFNYANNFTTDSNILDIDTLLTTSVYGGGFINARGIDLADFIVDDFKDSSINTTLIKIDNASGLYSICGGVLYVGDCDPSDQYLVTISNSESGGSLNLDYLFEEDVHDSNIQTETMNIGFYVPHHYINVWTPKNIYFNFNYTHAAFEKESSSKCVAYTQSIIGNQIVWQSPWQTCQDAGTSSCNAGSESLGDLIINASRNLNGTWTVKIQGSERTFGDDIEAGECGAYSYVYNWTNGSLIKTYAIQGGLCSLVNSITQINNTQLISFAAFADFMQLTRQFRINTYNRGNYNDDDKDGCSDIQTNIFIKNINQSLYNMTSGWLFSNAIFNSDGDIDTIQYNADIILPAERNDTISKYFSADNGITYELIPGDDDTALSNPGKDLKYALYFNLSEEGYFTKTSATYEVGIASLEGYPTNIFIDLGNDGIVEGNFSGELNETTGPYYFNITNYNPYGKFTNLRYIAQNMALFPIAIYSTTVGELNLTNMQYSYDPNPIRINVTNIIEKLKSLINFGKINISVNATNGTINFTDLKQDYAGGNFTYEVLAHNSDYTINESLNVTYHYSRWDYEFVSANVNWIYFSPPSPVEQNITPYGQDDSTPILNLTNLGYGGLNATLSIYENSSLECVNTTISLSNNKSLGFQLNESWVELTNMSYLETVDIYLFADYNCNYTTWRTFEPYYYFRMCVEGGSCSISLI